jgi:hypothetical protein
LQNGHGKPSRHGALIGLARGIVSTLVLTPVTQSGYWRVKMAWANKRPRYSRYFGKFQSREEAEKWIEKHRWLTEQTQELDEAQP